MADAAVALIGPLEDEIARKAASRFARWDGALFRGFCERLGRAFAWVCLRGPSPGAVTRAYLELAAEAIGLGYITPRDLAAVARGRPKEAPNPIALFWLQQLTGWGFHLRTGRNNATTSVPAEERIALMTRLWNLGEGLCEGPAWLCRHATRELADVAPEDLDSVAELLVDILEPALEPRPPARFTGPFEVAVLDLAEVDESFLPGDMHLAAPAVVCVHDRRRPGASAGAFLRSGRASTALPPGPCLGDFAATTGVPAVRVAPGEALVGTGRAPLPLLGRARSFLAVASGFVVVSAVDSQRLWVVESP